MDLRGIAAVLLKVAGLVLVATSVAHLPSYFPPRIQGADWSITTSFALATLTQGPVIVLGVLLWLFPGRISNRIVRAGEQNAEVDYGQVHLIAITVLGLYLIANGCADLMYNISTMIQLKREHPDLEFTPSKVAGGIAAAAVQVLIGAIFCAGAKRIVGMIRSARG